MSEQRCDHCGRPMDDDGECRKMTPEEIPEWARWLHDNAALNMKGNKITLCNEHRGHDHTHPDLMPEFYYLSVTQEEVASATLFLRPDVMSDHDDTVLDCQKAVILALKMCQEMYGDPLVVCLGIEGICSLQEDHEGDDPTVDWYDSVNDDIPEGLIAEALMFHTMFRQPDGSVGQLGTACPYFYDDDGMPEFSFDIDSENARGEGIDMIVAAFRGGN